MNEENENDHPITVVEVKEIETAFAGGAGNRYCDIWIVSDSGQNIALRFSQEIGQLFQEKLAKCLAVIADRSTH